MITLFSILVLIFSIIIHEVAHGAMAERLGDKTAREMGRISLNPIKHIDLFGSIIIPLFLILTKSSMLIGWAKPVPINPYALRDRKYGEAKVALAGPLANIAVAVLFGLILRFVPLGVSAFSQNLVLILQYIVWINLLLAVFNLTPIPPLDGSHILFALLPKSAESVKFFLNQFGVFFLIIYIFFVFSYLVPLIALLFKLLTGLFRGDLSV
ncbi:MAG: site-2 protease family protein [Candidatus Pacebacteria bacterium]|nr:site-2 protease family protein [Candidatus Paceibacterota bacterium]